MMNIVEHLTTIQDMSKEILIRYLKDNCTVLAPSFLSITSGYNISITYILKLEDATILYDVGTDFNFYGKKLKTTVGYDIFDQDTRLCVNAVSRMKDSPFISYSFSYWTVAPFVRVKNILSQHMFSRWNRWIRCKDTLLRDHKVEYRKQMGKIEALYTTTLERSVNNTLPPLALYRE